MSQLNNKYQDLREEFDRFKQELTQPFEQTIFRWCEANGIFDVRPYRWDSNQWDLGWPPYLPDTKERILRKIDLYVPMKEDDKSFKAYSGAFVNHSYPPLKVKFCENRDFLESELEMKLDELKKYADGLDEKDLVLFSGEQTNLKIN